MLSLASSASPWINDEQISKKRVSNMRRSMQMISSKEDNTDPLNDVSNVYASVPILKNVEGMSADRNSRVNEILNKITSTSSASENNKLGEFVPITPPKIQVKRDFDEVAMPREYAPPTTSYLAASNANKENMSVANAPTYTANSGKGKDYSNYMRSYEPPSKPYYANMGIGTQSAPNDKMMERINYMIHLLEAQQHEKTNNITEEFLLYSFLGVFIIYVVDSFARVGKYTR
jgi:hypothetical protein